MDISFIGSGNLAWHLAPALDNAGYIVREVYSRNPKHAEALTGRLYQADVMASLDFSSSKSRIFIIAVPDDSIQVVATEIVLPDEAYLIHTSGSQPLSSLQFAAAKSTAIFYPLQTFSHDKRVDFKTTPIFIESSDEECERVLTVMAKSISTNVNRIDSDGRKALHVAAVFASNFTNHMLRVSKDILEKNSLSFDLLKPLISETINKSLSVGPEQAQTGAARQCDLLVLDQHVELLREDERVAHLYRIISQHIIDTYGLEKNQ